MEPSLYWYSEDYLAPNGIFVSTMGGPTAPGILGKTIEVLSFLWAHRPALLGGVRRQWMSMLTEHREEELQQISQWMEEGKVKPVVDSTFEFEDALAAYKRLMSGRASGKVIVRVNPNAK